VTARRPPESVIGLLDVGTSKTVCVIIAPPRGRRSTRVLGIGHTPSRGLKAGVVVEFDEAEQAVRGAVGEAERMAGVAVEEVLLAVACGRLKSSTFSADLDVEGRVVAARDIERLLAAGRSYAERDGRVLLHMNAITYRLDNAAAITEPHGLAGRKLGAEVHAVTADDAPLRNLLHVVERAYLSVAGLVPSPYASGVAATTEEERRLGVTCLDLGAGTTSVAIFADGHLLATDVLPIGGNHLTFDVARGLSLPVSEAERIKRVYGTLASGECDDHEFIAHAPSGPNGDAAGGITRGRVRELVRGRTRGLFEHVAERTRRSGVAHYAMQRMVLTGGVSQQAGLGEFAADCFSRIVRVASLPPLEGMPPGFAGPAFSTAAGLCQLAFDPAAGVRRDRVRLEPTGYLRRVGEWLRESF
jgi:cell division protein FtsA